MSTLVAKPTARPVNAGIPDPGLSAQMPVRPPSEGDGSGNRTETALKRTQRIIRQGYEEAKSYGHVSFAHLDNGAGLDISEVISGKYGNTQKSFPLPNGETIRVKLGIGLPSFCTNVRLLSMRDDDQGRGQWLEISAEVKERGERITTHILLTSKKGVTGEAALVCYGPTRERALTTLRVREGYERAKEQGIISFTECDNGKGLDISEVISTYGRTQASFPLPNGETMQAQLAIGLPNPCINPRLLSIRKDDQGRGLWVEISGKSREQTETISRVLLTLEKKVTGKAAILKYHVKAPPTQTQKQIVEGYEKAESERRVTFTHLDKGEGLCISEVISSGGKTQRTLPLPNGETIQANLGIGLPNPCTNPRLLSVTKDDEGRGLWLEISGEGKDRQKTISRVLLTLDAKVTGKAAILEYHAQSPLTPTQKQIIKGYEQAKREGRVSYAHVDNGEGLEILGVIGSRGTTQKSFPLPNGETIKANLGIGLPVRWTNPRLLAISYDKEKDLYSLHIRATSLTTGLPRETTLVLKGEKGLTKRDAIHSYSEDLSDELPVAFRARLEAAQKTTQRLATRAGLKRGVARNIAYTKGQCFEQLVGVLLAAESPDERVLPQYCLKVDEHRGYYGTRVDFKVGERFFEVKWGKATRNIADTYERHTKIPGVDPSSYNVITLCRNEEIHIPYGLFSEKVERSPLHEELNEAMARISSLVHQGEQAGDHDKETKRRCVLNLEVIRGYLYNAFHRVGTSKEGFLKGEERIESLRGALRLLNETPDEHLARELSPMISRHWSSLEAYWEYDGEVRRSLVPVHQLIEEEPEAYDLGFCYERVFYEAEESERSVRSFATFRDTEDFKLLSVLDEMTSPKGESLWFIPESVVVEGEKDEHGWFVKPIFKVSVGEIQFSFSRHEVEGRHRQIRSYAELRQLAEEHGLIAPENMSELCRIIDDLTDTYASFVSVSAKRSSGFSKLKPRVESADEAVAFLSS